VTVSMAPVGGGGGATSPTNFMSLMGVGQ
jgi:hypothetical protein